MEELEQDVMESIKMAFNLGVWMKHTQEAGSIQIISKKLEEIIYWKMFEAYGDKCPQELIRDNVEYFVQIALLGYILPGVAIPDELIKGRLISLIHARVRRNWESQFEQAALYPAFS